VDDSEELVELLEELELYELDSELLVDTFPSDSELLEELVEGGL